MREKETAPEISEEMARLGLDPVPGKYPRIVQIGDQIYLRTLVEGRDVECEIGIRRGFILLVELALALARVVPR